MAAKKRTKSKSTQRAGKKNISTTPKKEKPSSSMPKLFVQDAPNPDNPIFKKVFWAVSILFLLLMPALSFQYGIAGDETDMHLYGQDVLKYYTSGGEDRTFEQSSKYNPNGILKYYGGLFDIIAESTNNLFGLTETSPYETRHFINALFGFMGILFAGLAGYLIGGWRMGLLALIFMAISPRYFGESMNNTKDIPFAATYMAGLFFMIKYLKELPRPKWSTAAFLAIAIGLCINTRVGGLLLIPYFAVFLFIEIMLRRKMFFGDLGQKNWKNVMGYTLLPLGIVIVGYFIGSLFWPYALGNPITNPVAALSEMTKYPVNIRILYGGDHLFSADVPWNYIPNWIIRSNPSIILFGVFASIFFFFNRLKYRSTKYIAFIGFAALFPIFYAILQRSNLYDGWRHFLFVYPALTILAAYAWDWILHYLDTQKAVFQYIGKGILGLGIAMPIIWSVLNHPNQVVYFNPLFGGMKGNYANYELDYYMNSVKQACDWIIENEDLTKEKIVIATTTTEQVENYFKDYPNIQVIYARYYQRYARNWDYGIFYNRYITREQLLNGSYPPPQTVYTVDVGGKPICAVVKHEDKSVQEGFQAMKDRDFNTAIQKFEIETQARPLNDLAWQGLAQSYATIGDVAKALDAANKGLDVDPRSATMLYLKGNIQINIKDVEGAAQTAAQITTVKPRYAGGWFIDAQVKALQGLRNQALESATKAIQYSGNNEAFVNSVREWASKI